MAGYQSFGNSSKINYKGQYIENNFDTSYHASAGLCKYYFQRWQYELRGKGIRAENSYKDKSKVLAFDRGGFKFPGSWILEEAFILQVSHMHIIGDFQIL